MITKGQVLNDTYEVIERLGSGGGGIIYKAYHRRMQKYVAIYTEYAQSVLFAT